MIAVTGGPAHEITVTSDRGDLVGRRGRAYRRGRGTTTGVDVLQMIRDVLVETVFAGALTALVLGHGVLGLILLVVGGVVLSMALRGHRYLSFGASKKLTTIDL